MQETHLKNEDLKILEKEWPGTIHMSEGTANSKGLVTLFHKNISSDNLKLVFKNGRALISEVREKEKKLST